MSHHRHATSLWSAAFSRRFGGEYSVAFAPIFIIGVPRSGTTLLRVLLDSHSEIAGLPETPWLLGAYGADTCLRSFLTGLVEGPYGAVRNVAGITPEHVFASGRSLLETLFEPVLKARNKRLLAFKTPADIRHLDVLLKLAPDAYYVHITRDGRDVAMSQLGKKGTFFDDLKEYKRLGFSNLLRRWAEWESRIRSLLYRDGTRVVHVRYEDLIANPERELRRITDFLGVPFEARMLDYASHRHDYPSWEAGSTDVARHDGISKSGGSKWRKAKLTGEMLYALRKYDSALVESGYAPSDLKPDALSRMSAALFPLLNPVLDMAAKLRLKARPLFRSPARIWACVALLLLALQFLLPAAAVPAPASDVYQPLLCFAVALAAASVFGPALMRREGAGGWLSVKMAAAFIVVIGVLELAQSLVPGRVAGLSDFAVNAAAGVFATVAGMTLMRGRKTVDRPAVSSHPNVLPA